MPLYCQFHIKSACSLPALGLGKARTACQDYGMTMKSREALVSALQHTILQHRAPALAPMQLPIWMPICAISCFLRCEIQLLILQSICYV